MLRCRHQVLRDEKHAEKLYLSAVSLEPQSARVLNLYAKFLKNAKRDFDKAEARPRARPEPCAARS